MKWALSISQAERLSISALVAAIFIGKRTNKDSVRPHNIPMTMIGAGLLLFGWFGFNTGEEGEQALAYNGDAELLRATS